MAEGVVRWRLSACMSRCQQNPSVSFGVPAYHIMAANKAWCEGCGRRRISEIMNKN